MPERGQRGQTGHGRDQGIVGLYVQRDIASALRNLPISDQTRRMPIDFSILVVIEEKQRKRYSEKKEFVSCFVLRTRIRHASFRKKMTSLKKGYFILNLANVRAY